MTKLVDFIYQVNSELINQNQNTHKKNYNNFPTIDKFYQTPIWLADK